MNPGGVHGLAAHTTWILFVKMPASDQGPLTGRYTVIPRTLIFLIHCGEVLLIKGSPQKRLWANRYNGLGGHVEKGEDILTGARRELAEETGLWVADLRLCGTVSVDTGQEMGILIFVLRGECSSQECLSEQIVASSEGTLEWIPFDRVDQLPLVEDLPTLLPRVLSMKPGDPPFSARSFYDQEEKLVVSFSS